MINKEIKTERADACFKALNTYDPASFIVWEWTERWRNKVKCSVHSRNYDIHHPVRVNGVYLGKFGNEYNFVLSDPRDTLAIVSIKEDAQIADIGELDGLIGELGKKKVEYSRKSEKAVEYRYELDNIIGRMKANGYNIYKGGDMEHINDYIAELVSLKRQYSSIVNKFAIDGKAVTSKIRKGTSGEIKRKISEIEDTIKQFKGEVRLW